MTDKEKAQVTMALWGCWVSGIVAGLFAHSMRQDLSGLENYVAMVRLNWVDTHWGMWCALLVINVAAQMVVARRWRP